MKKLLGLEIRHILKMRSTLATFAILCLAAIGVAVISSYGETAFRLKQDGTGERLSGIAAQKEIRMADTEGVLSEERLLEVFRKQRPLFDRYGLYPPEEVFVKEVFPDNRILRILSSVYRKEDGSYDPAFLGKLTEADILDFYERRGEMIRKHYAGSYGEGSVVYEKVMREESRVSTPFPYYTFSGWPNALQNLGALLGILVFLSALLLTAQFSGNYQNGADAIYRTTRYGRRELALARFLAAALVSCLCYVLLISLYTGLSVAFFGKNGLKAPVQLFDAYAVKPYVVGQVYVRLVLMGALTLTAMLAVSMYLAARIQSRVYAMSLVLALLLLPAVLGGDPGPAAVSLSGMRRPAVRRTGVLRGAAGNGLLCVRKLCGMVSGHDSGGGGRKHPGLGASGGKILCASSGKQMTMSKSPKGLH
ncbi:MAG: hypothetical protein LBQ15_04860 [Clostridium sp.]|jgi:hypothetical protein|nr:hypothetical protein [Clostridium sp.]